MSVRVPPPSLPAVQMLFWFPPAPFSSSLSSRTLLRSFGTWLSRQTFPAGCSSTSPCHVYLGVPHNISDSMLITAHTAVGAPTLTVVFQGVVGTVPASVAMQRFEIAGARGQRRARCSLRAAVRAHARHHLHCDYRLVRLIARRRRAGCHEEVPDGPFGQSPVQLHFWR